MTSDADFAQHPADTEWHRWARIGQTLDTSGVPGSGPVPSIAAFELLPIEPMLAPEKPRHGETDASECGHCKPSKITIWQDEEWQVRSGFEGGVGLPFVGSISPRRHVKLENAPLEVLSGLGTVLQRVSEATKTIPAVARCHFSRWNDGSAHLHLWVYARPLGMMQGRGAILPYWEQSMPAMPEAMMKEHIEIVAAALAAGGGEAFPHR